MSVLKVWNGSAWVAVTDETKAPDTHSHAGSDITSGTVDAARLGSGTPSSANFLRGDGSWQPVTQEIVQPWNDGATYMALAGAQYTSQFADAHAFMRRVDAANGNFMSITMPVPTWHINYDGSNDVVVRITYSLSAAPSAGNAVRWQVSYSSLALGAVYGTLTTSAVTTVVDAVTALTYVQHTFNTSSGWVAAGEIAHIVVNRQGTNAADTYTGDVRGHCIEILAKRKVLA
jgi:hypothetical protein